MEAQEFVSQLDECIARFDLLCHPFYKAWSNGWLTRDNLREYASSYYHHVSAFPTCLSAFHSRLEDGAMRRAVLSNLYEEELDGRPHAEMWLDFAEGMGADRAQTATHEPIEELTKLVTYFRQVARNGSRAEVLATFYAYESQVPRVAREKARGLKKMYGADDRTCGYFTLHTFADVRHSQVWRELLTEEIATHPEQKQAALEAAGRAAEALWSALDGFEVPRSAAA